MQTTLPNPLEILFYFLFFIQLRWLNLIELAIIWISLAILLGLLARFIRRRAIKVGLPADAVNGVVLALRLVFIWAGLTALFLIVPELWDTAAGVIGGSSLLIGTAVGLSLGQAVRNFVAGLYVMFTNPFDVNDYVRIGENEGIVVEISMNYTKIRQPDGSIALIPNSKVLDSSVTNFRFRKRSKDRDEGESPETGSLPRRIYRSVKDVIDTSNLVQYTFQMKFPVKKKIDDLTKSFNQVCRTWKSKFGFKPVFALSDISHIAFTYSFTIFVEDPKILLESKSNFIEDIARVVHT